MTDFYQQCDLDDDGGATIMMMKTCLTMLILVSGFYLPLASGVAGGDIARLISSREGPWDHQDEHEDEEVDESEVEKDDDDLVIRDNSHWRTESDFRLSDGLSVTKYRSNLTG